MAYSLTITQKADLKNIVLLQSLSLSSQCFESKFSSAKMTTRYRRFVFLPWLVFTLLLPICEGVRSNREPSSPFFPGQVYGFGFDDGRLGTGNSPYRFFICFCTISYTRIKRWTATLVSDALSSVSVTAISAGGSYSLTLDGLSDDYISLDLFLKARAGGCWPSDITVMDGWGRATGRAGIENFIFK